MAAPVSRSERRGGQPRGKEAVQRALLDAAAELFASRGAAAVSVRDIAAAAGVNHGLVHRHFGSKDELRRRVLADLTAGMASGWGVEGAERTELDPDDLTRGALEMPAMDRYFRMLARALLDGEPVEALQERFPVVDMFLARIERGQKDGTIRDDVPPRVLAALGVSAALGWLLFSPFVVAALGLRREKRLPQRLVATWFEMTRRP
jgi:AcrR family transcriptional regulator